MNRELKKLKIKSIGRKIKYKKLDKTTSSMCAVRAEDLKGVEHEALAWGDLCNTLKVGKRVVATKQFSLRKSDHRFVILKSLD
jgi:hypothetical protein